MIAIHQVHFSTIKPSTWRANHILASDRTLLIQSMINYQWLSPILVQRSSMSIIDGFSRWVISQNQKEILLRDKGQVPVVLVDIDDADAMIMHVRVNRSRGNLVPARTSELIQQLRSSGKYSDESLSLQMMMTHLEFYTLADGRAIKIKTLKEHEYSKAWIPTEAPPAGVTIAGDIVIERPPNADR
jgi:hypothetical protein